MILDDVAFHVPGAGVFNRMSLDADAEYAAELKQEIDALRAVALPKVVYEVVNIGDRAEDRVTLGPVHFASRVLSRNLAGVERVFAFVAT